MTPSSQSFREELRARRIELLAQKQAEFSFARQKCVENAILQHQQKNAEIAQGIHRFSELGIGVASEPYSYVPRTDHSSSRIESCQGTVPGQPSHARVPHVHAVPVKHPNILQHLVALCLRRTH